MPTVTLFGITYVSRESLIAATGCSADVFRRAEAVDGLPRIKWGKRAYYPEAAVKAWIERRMQQEVVAA